MNHERNWAKNMFELKLCYLPQKINSVVFNFRKMDFFSKSNKNFMIFTIHFNFK